MDLTLSFSCTMTEMRVATSPGQDPSGTSQEPVVTQHGQCLHQLGTVPQSWVLITGSINGPRQGKLMNQVQGPNKAS